jgi:uncharacterized membrane protein YphA (DoxX/SURF4 family)
MTANAKNKVSWTLSIILGITFIGAAVMKFNYAPNLEKDIATFFSGQAGELGLGVSVLARCLIAFELALGLALLQPYWRKRILLPLYLITLILFSVYLLTLAPDADNCGCFGSWLPMTPRESLVKNFVFAFITIITYFISPGDPKGTVLVPVLCVIGAAGLTFAIIPPSRYEMDLGTLGTFQNEKQPVTKGIALVCFLNSTCEHCEEAAMDLDDFHRKWEMPTYFVLQGTEVQIREYLEMTGTEQMPWKTVDIRFFLSATGKAPPRYHLVKDGRSVKFWDGKFDETAITDAVKELAGRGLK